MTTYKTRQLSIMTWRRKMNLSQSTWIHSSPLSSQYTYSTVRRSTWKLTVRRHFRTSLIYIVVNSATEIGSISHRIPWNSSLHYHRRIKHQIPCGTLALWFLLMICILQSWTIVHTYWSKSLGGMMTISPQKCRTCIKRLPCNSWMSPLMRRIRF